MSTLRASGKGISEAVRQTIQDWVDDTLVQAFIRTAGVTSDYQTYTLKHELGVPSFWLRSKRTGNKDKGWTRMYRNQRIPEVSLEIKTNPADNIIRYFVFRYKDKYVDGGASDVASVLSNRDHADKARLDNHESIYRRILESDLAGLE